LANNHAGDFGEDGVRKTAATIESLGAQVVGLRDWDLIRVGREKLAIQAWTQWENHQLKRESLSRPNRIRGGAPPEVPHLARIALPHWGLEFRYFPTAEQRAWAREWAAQDVRLIVGHHGHVAQPMEWINGAGGKTLAAYSIGNWLGVQWSWPTMNFGTLIVELETEGDRRGQVASYEMLCLQRAPHPQMKAEIRLHSEASERKHESETIFRRVGWLADRDTRR
jgi:poly-gamma-glutamate capsule biosynthesis protein CapA/YwtB (metallophosphatase superfamily)